MKQYRNKGTLKEFTKYCQRLKIMGIPFTTETYGNTGKVIFPNKTVYCFTNNKNMDVVNLCKVASINANKWLRNNEVPENLKSAPIKKYNKKRIKELVGRNVVSIDLNHCYWRIAYLEGIISEKTYKLGLEPEGIDEKEKQDYKQNRLIAIGNLNKQIKVTDEEDKIKIIKKPVSVCWDYILFKVAQIYQKLYEMLGEDLLWWQTDEVVTLQNRVLEVVGMFSEMELPYKIDDLYLNRIENNKLYYYSEAKQKERKLSVSF